MIGATTTLADALRSRLQRHVTDTGRSRASLITLLTMQAQIEGHAATRPGARTRLTDALTELSQQGLVETPRSPRLWDRAAHPALPEWISILTDLPAKTTPFDVGTTTWVPAISRWVGEWIRQCRPSSPLRTALHEINTWLLHHLGTRPAPVAREERSLTIFGNEKVLARIESSSIFAAGRLEPRDLAYDRPVAPMRAARLAGRGDLLIVENQATFDSAWRALHQCPGAFAAVAFGGGWEAAQAEPIAALQDHLQLATPPRRIYYAGDLDIDGLDIPHTLAANLSVIGLPEPQPLVGAYDAMLQRHQGGAGHPASRATDDLALRAVGWLAERHRDAARALLTDGERIAQETLDRQWWATNAWRPDIE